jgi:tetratricopeptide (TPR) repeat protein
MNTFELRVDEKPNYTYCVQLLGTDAQSEFELRFDLAEKQVLQYIMDGISHGDAEEEFEIKLKNYGNTLYNYLFDGVVGEEFRRLSKDGFCLRLHLPPGLESLPWEYLVAEGEFIFKCRENVLIRTPTLEEKAAALKTISRPVRLLVIISNPPDLPEFKKLDVVREKRLIKEALKPLIEEGRLVVKWEDEASLERIHDTMLAFNPHIIHYTGHGGFADGGVLLLEDGYDKSLNVSGTKLAERLANRDIRLVVLSGCQTAKAKTSDSFSSVAGALVKKGIPAVIAMQQSIRDDSANIFASRFYRALASGQPVDVALGEARLSMHSPRATIENSEPHSLVDWGIPVLITSARDLNLFKLDVAAPPPVPPAPKSFSKVNLPNPGDIFVGRQKEQRLIARALKGGDAHCIMILGPGGIGKSSLAARAVEQTEEHFHAVYTIGCKSVPTAEQILLELNTFLTLNGNKMFDQVMAAPLDIAQKIEYLPQALNASRYLIIFDNFEDMLDATREPHVVKDELVRHLLETFTINLRESRVMITSRLDFLFTRDSRYQANILSVLLPDLTIMEAFRLIANMPALCNTTTEEKLLIYEKAGGSPYIINLVAAAAKDLPIGNVLRDVKEQQKKFVGSMLLNKLYGWLPDDATKKFFRCVSVYRKPVNHDFLVAMGGNDERIGYLLHKSLLNRIAESTYEMHTNTRSFAFDLHEQIDGTSGLKESQITAAEMYLNSGKDKGDADEFLESRWFFYSAGEYNKAGELVLDLSEPLHRWGFINLVRGLDEETVESATGVVKAAALHHLGMIHQDQGRYEEAMKMYSESLKIEEELGDKGGIARTLHQRGNVLYLQGRYEEAVKMYQESLKIKEESIDKSGIASTLHQLGMIHQDQGRYEEAVKLYEESLKIKEELGDKKGIAYTLHQLGMIHQNQGRYEEAEKMYQESLKMSEELYDKRGIAYTLHQLGMIHQDQGRYEEAVKLYEESLRIKEELGDKRGLASTFRQLGMIHHEEGEHEEALKDYGYSLVIFRELGAKQEVADTSLQLGKNLVIQGKWHEALDSFNDAFKLFRRMNDLNGEAGALFESGLVHHLMNNYELARRYYKDSLRLYERIKNERGKARVMFALGRLDLQTQMFKDATHNLEDAEHIFLNLKDAERIKAIRHMLHLLKGVKDE